MVAQDGAADSGAELLLVIFWFRIAGGFVEGIVGLKCGVAVVVERAAMEGVTPGAGDGVHEAGSAAVDCSVGTHRDLKLLDRILAK